MATVKAHKVTILGTYNETVMNWLRENREGIIAEYQRLGMISRQEISLKTFMTIIMEDMLAASKVAQNNCMKRGYGLTRVYDKAERHAIMAARKHFNSVFFDRRYDEDGIRRY